MGAQQGVMEGALSALPLSSRWQGLLRRLKIPGQGLEWLAWAGIILRVMEAFTLPATPPHLNLCRRQRNWTSTGCDRLHDAVLPFFPGVIHSMGYGLSGLLQLLDGGIQLGDVLHDAFSWWTVLSMRRPKQESKRRLSGAGAPGRRGLTLPLFFWQVDLLWRGGKT